MLFTDDTMQHYNWTGQLGKKAINTSKLYKIIRGGFHGLLIKFIIINLTILHFYFLDVLDMDREQFHKAILDSRRKLLNRVFRDKL